MAPLMGAHHLMRPGGGRGVLVCGVPGVRCAKVVILGAGVAGMAAATLAVGMHSEVYILDRNLERLRQVDHHFRGASRRWPRAPTPSRRPASTPTSSSAPCWSSGPKPPSWSPTTWWRRCGTVRCWWTSRWTRAAASSRPGPPPIRTPPSRSTARSSTAWPTCPGRCPTPPPMHWSTPPCPTCWTSPTTAGGRPCRADPALAEGINVVEGSVVYEPVAEAHGMTPVPLAPFLD